MLLRQPSRKKYSEFDLIAPKMSRIDEIIRTIEKTLKNLEEKRFGKQIMLPEDYDLAKELEEKRQKDLEKRRQSRDEKRRFWDRATQKQKEKRDNETQTETGDDQEILEPVSDYDSIDYAPSPAIVLPKAYVPEPEIPEKHIAFKSVAIKGQRPLPIYNDEDVLEPCFVLSKGEELPPRDIIDARKLFRTLPPRPLPALGTYDSLKKKDAWLENEIEKREKQEEKVQLDPVVEYNDKKSSKNSKKQKKNKKTKTNTSGKGLVLADWMKAIGNGKIGIKFKNPVKALKQKKKKSKSSKDAFVDVKDMEEVKGKKSFMKQLKNKLSTKKTRVKRYVSSDDEVDEKRRDKKSRKNKKEKTKKQEKALVQESNSQVKSPAFLEYKMSTKNGCNTHLTIKMSEEKYDRDLLLAAFKMILDGKPEEKLRAIDVPYDCTYRTN